ncbi:hypothetical protein [Streptomyces sp. TLI_171]|uniref:hypothetical protein n=1 Tax=Streptomyces sp. TLI_171 TaxID=1938859 RepID=UPI000C17515E|nr:hypothetical protein [Streptomyces sp. TLI_171]RKE23397.1 hypothetical protein BX266_6865 [Streptomyces sp. TLI_171]
MELISGTGRAWPPWPELMPGHRPALVAPADPTRPVRPQDGWTTPGCAPAPHPDWSAVFDGTRLTVHRPDGTRWFDGPIAAAREWTRAARTHRTLLIVTGEFGSAFDLPAAAADGRLLLIAMPLRLVDAP